MKRNRNGSKVCNRRPIGLHATAGGSDPPWAWCGGPGYSEIGLLRRLSKRPLRCLRLFMAAPAATISECRRRIGRPRRGHQATDHRGRANTSFATVNSSPPGWSPKIRGVMIGCCQQVGNSCRILAQKSPTCSLWNSSSFAARVRKSSRRALPPKVLQICPDPAPGNGTALQLPLSLLSPSCVWVTSLMCILIPVQRCLPTIPKSRTSRHVMAF
jgi:hypothetical protein